MQTVFESDDIRFVRVSELLVGDYLVMVNDMDHVERFLGGAHEPFTEEQEIEWVRRKLKENEPVFSMIEKESGEFIGNIELMDVRDGVGELGISITAAKQNLGYGTQAVAALTEFGMERLRLNRIFLRTNPDNARAIRVYEKCGFREYDRTAGHVYMEIMR